MTGCGSRRTARADTRNMAMAPHRHVSAPRKWATCLTARPPTGYTRFLARRAARQRRGGRAAEGAPLLREYTGKTCIESSNLSLSARRQRVTVCTVTLFAFTQNKHLNLPRHAFFRASEPRKTSCYSSQIYNASQGQPLPPLYVTNNKSDHSLMRIIISQATSCELHFFIFLYKKTPI